MKLLTQTDNHLLLRFDRHEDFLTQLVEFCQQNTIHAASFSGLGAAGDITIAYYNLETRQYEDHQFTENLEILNLTGNVAVMDNKPIVHCHGVFGRQDCSTIGGHVKKLIVSATCEIFMTKFENKLERGFDEATGLNLLI